ncbi:MAG: protein kinase [Lachnospira sp.]|nr:protein kinase [Lachnospira sp.]
MIADGTVLNDTYQIVQQIGTGGVGVVYKAYHLRLQKYVVIKMIKENFVGNINVRGEVDLLKKLHHPCLPQVYDFIQLETQVYTVMDYISGENLEEYKQREGQIRQEDAVKWLVQLCEVLVYLHSQKPAIIHCDIKPQNIIIDEEGNANLIDFNISFEEDSMDLQGISQSYASYEQLEAVWYINNRYELPQDFIDATTDIYSLGATFYYLLTDIVPYAGISEDYPLTTFDIPYSAGLVQIIHKSMQRERIRRYTSAEEMLEDVKNLKKKTVRYRISRIAAATAVVGTTMIMAAGLVWGIGSIYAGNEQKQEKAYQKVNLLNGYTQEEEQQIEAFLNSRTYQMFLNKNPKKKAALLYKIGNYCFIREDFQNAQNYFSEAAQLDTDNGDYMRDTVVALARSNQLQQAQQVLEEYKKIGLDTDNLEEMSAEIQFIQGNYSESAKTAKELLETNKPAQLQNRAVYLLAESYWQQKQYTQCLEVLEKINVQAVNTDTLCLLKMNTCLYAGQTNSSLLKEEYYLKAQAYYSRIENKEICTLKDCLNISAAYQATGRYDLSIQILDMLKQNYKDDYRIYMQEAYCYYYQMKTNKDGADKVKEYYNLALPLYKAVASGSGETDEDMQKLEQIFQTLK